MIDMQCITQIARNARNHADENRDELIGVIPLDPRRPRPAFSSQSGLSLIELMIAGAVLVIASLGVMAMISTAIASNNRNKIDSTKTMLAQAVLEEVNATLIGNGSATLKDCAGNSFTITTANGGAKLLGSGSHPNDTLGQDIDFSQSGPPAGYQMNYVVMSPCQSGGQYVATYDVRWHVDQIGAAGATPSNSFLVTVGAKQQGVTQTGSMSGVYFSLPVNMRVIVGRPE